MGGGLINIFMRRIYPFYLAIKNGLLVFCKFVLSGIVFFFIFVENLSAACVCNWSYCQPGGDGLYYIAGAPHFGPCTSSIGLPNDLWGGYCSDKGTCTPTSTCFRHSYLGPGLPGDTVLCSECSADYGDCSGEPTFDDCVLSCTGGTGGGGGGSSCTIGPAVTENTCEVATNGEPNGLWARYQQWINDTEGWRFVAQGIYPQSTEGTMGYWNGYEVNHYPSGWEYFGTLQLLPGACPNWGARRISGYIEIDQPGTYAVRSDWKNIYLQVQIDNDDNPATPMQMVADTSGSYNGNSETSGLITNNITFPASLSYPHWFNISSYITTGDYAPWLRFHINGTLAGSSWYNGWQYVQKVHTSPCNAPASNIAPSCTISGPTSAVAGYPLTFLVNGSDTDSNMIRLSVNHSPITSETWGSPLNYYFSNTGAYSTSATIAGGLPTGSYYVGCNTFDAASAQCSFNPWCSEWLPDTTTSHTCSGWVDCGPNDFVVVNVSPYINPWFQVIGGNVMAKLGVSSPIPATAYNTDFIRDPVGLLIRNGSLSLGTANIANKPIVNATTISKPEATFDLFFNKKLPQEIKTAITLDMAGCNSHLGCAYNSNTISLNSLTGCSSFRGYLICYYNGQYNPGSGALGNLTLTGNLLTTAGQRIILFVENASVTFAGTIKPQTGTRGRSSFLVISEGGINISPTVGSALGDNNPDLEGVFYTDGVFDSGTSKPGSDDINLHIRGSVVAGSFNLNRDLGSGAVGEKNDRYPGEYFEYGAEQVMAFPPFLRLRSTSWSEVAP